MTQDSEPVEVPEDKLVEQLTALWLTTVANAKQYSSERLRSPHATFPVWQHWDKALNAPFNASRVLLLLKLQTGVVNWVRAWLRDIPLGMAGGSHPDLGDCPAVGVLASMGIALSWVGRLHTKLAWQYHFDNMFNMHFKPPGGEIESIIVSLTQLSMLKASMPEDELESVVRVRAQLVKLTHDKPANLTWSLQDSRHYYVHKLPALRLLYDRGWGLERISTRYSDNFDHMFHLEPPPKERMPDKLRATVIHIDTASPVLGATLMQPLLLEAYKRNTSTVVPVLLLAGESVGAIKPYGYDATWVKRITNPAEHTFANANGVKPYAIGIVGVTVYDSYGSMLDSLMRWIHDTLAPNGLVVCAAPGTPVSPGAQLLTNRVLREVNDLRHMVKSLGEDVTQLESRENHKVEQLKSLQEKLARTSAALDKAQQDATSATSRLRVVEEELNAIRHGLGTSGRRLIKRYQEDT